MMGMGRIRLAATLALIGAPLSGCQALLPRDDTPTVLPRLAAAPANVPSAQRLDQSGYPMLGAFPRAASAQASDEEVQATRDRFANVGARGSRASAAGYQRNVDELRTLARTQQAEADARLRAASGAAGADDAAASSRAQ